MINNFNDLIFLDSVKKMPLMSLPVRSTLVRLQSGAVLISPGSCLQLTQLQSLKNVTDIIAPNFFHCAGVALASSVYPNARKWVPPEGKLVKPDIAWSDELTTEKWPYQDELPMVQLKGIAKISEVIFFHKKSKSIIIADLCFNMPESKGLGPWIILNLFGTYKKLAVSKFFVRMADNKDELEKSLGEIFKFDFENIIVGHGENVIGSGKQKLLQILRERGLEPK